MTEHEFAEVAAYLQSAVGKAMSKHQASVYYDALKDLSIDQLKLAARRAVQETQYPVIPLIGVLRKFALEASVGIASIWSEEWETVVRAVSRFGYYRQAEAIGSLSPIAADVVRAIGWATLCDMPVADKSIVAGQFRMAYEARVQRDTNVGALSQDVRPKITGAAQLKVVGNFANRLGIDVGIKAS